ncbi:hypothetical protein [Pseudoxanthomonas sp. LARHCG66]
MGVLASIGSKIQHLLELATKLTIIGVPALYFAGWAYLDTYWSEFGIGDALLGYTSVDYIRSGALVLIQSLIGGAPWVLRFAWISVAVLVMLACIRTFGIPRLFGASRMARKFQAEMRRLGRVDPKHRAVAGSVDAVFESSQAGVLSLLLLFLFAVGLIYLGIKPAASKAKADAEKERVALSKLATLERNWVLGYTEAESARPALVMQCGNDMCVLLRSERTEAVPRSSITRMETCRRISKSDDGMFRCTTRTELL